MNNNAEIQGGAIYYNFKRPEMEDLTFSDNSAMYGPDIASYAVRIAEVDNTSQNITLSYLSSGMTLSESSSSSNHTQLELVLLDFDDQVMVLSDEATIKIDGVSTNSQIIGFGESKMNSGIAVFDTIGFQHEVGAQEIRFMASSKDINDVKVAYIDLTTDNSITANFRY